MDFERLVDVRLGATVRITRTIRPSPSATTNDDCADEFPGSANAYDGLAQAVLPDQWRFVAELMLAGKLYE